MGERPILEWEQKIHKMSLEHIVVSESEKVPLKKKKLKNTMMCIRRRTMKPTKGA